MEKHILTPEYTIGVFDSGIGGLNLLKECAMKIPCADFIYFADNYAVPYGSKTEEEILSRVLKVFDKMIEMRLSAAVVACNTATAVCIDVLRGRCPFPVVGIQPAVRQAARSGGRCAVLCTKATAASRSFTALLDRYGEGRTCVYPCADLAAYIEEHAPEIAPEGVLPLLPEIDADCVVLGCTHYVYIKKTIQNYYDLPVFDGMAGTADHLKTLLGICNHFSKNVGKISFIGGDISKNCDIFKHLMKNIKD